MNQWHIRCYCPCSEKRVLIQKGFQLGLYHLGSPNVFMMNNLNQISCCFKHQNKESKSLFMEVIEAKTETFEAIIEAEMTFINSNWGPTQKRILFVLALIFIIARIGLGILHLIAILYGKWKLHRRKDLVQLTEKSLPGVSILKPLVNSADPSLFQNLETFFQLDYPKYEIIFCIQCAESEDSQLEMYVDSLRNKYPTVPSKVFYGGESVGVNPKINNMHPGYKAAIHEFILISDSSIYMQSNTLSDMVGIHSN